MAYRLKKKECVPEGITRIVTEQIDRAIGELTDPAMDRHKAIHQARRRFKKIRAVLRLVRGELGEVYARENAWFRDAGRELARVRDADAMVETFDSLRAAADMVAASRPADTARAALVQRRERIAAEGIDLAEETRKLAEELRQARLRVETWPLAAGGFDALADGLARTCRRGRKAVRTVRRTPTAENFHELRKRVKYHRYQMCVLENLWPKVMKGRHRAMHDLSDLLGTHHDLAVLRQVVSGAGAPGTFGGEREVQVLLALIDGRQVCLASQAIPRCHRAFAEKTRRLGKRLREYWRAWRGKRD